MAGLECGFPVGGSHDDGHARLADLQPAHPVDHPDAVNAKLPLRLPANVLHFSNGQRLVCLVLKIERSPMVRPGAHDSFEDDHGTVLRRLESLRQIVSPDGVAGYFVSIHWRAATHRGHESHFVSVLQNLRVVRNLLVHGREKRLGSFAEPGEPAFITPPEFAEGLAFPYRNLFLTEPGQIVKQPEEQDLDLHTRFKLPAAAPRRPTGHTPTLPLRWRLRSVFGAPESDSP